MTIVSTHNWVAGYLGHHLNEVFSSPPVMLPRRSFANGSNLGQRAEKSLFVSTILIKL